METILTVKEESMIAVADAVREKSGTSGALSFPNGMVDAINSIETTTVDLTGYATEEYVNDAISNIEFPEADLTGYATETYVDEAIAAVGSGASDAASITFDDTAAQIGATTVQEAIEKLADEAASSTSVQLQIDENDISLAQDLQRYEPTKVYWFRGAVNASDYSWSSKICPELTYNQGVIHWDLDETNIYGVYANEYLAFQKQSGLEYIMKKGHYYQFRQLQLSDFKAFCNKYGRDGGNTEYYFGVQNSLPVIYSPVSTNIFALYYNVSRCYVMTDVTYVYADAAVSEDRVSEMITEALGVIENGTY
jgi:hypothetical protein